MIVNTHGLHIPYSLSRTVSVVLLIEIYTNINSVYFIFNVLVGSEV